MNILVGVSALCLSVLISVCDAEAAGLKDELQALARGWDHAAYEIPGDDAQLAALDVLEQKADAIADKYPDSVKPLAWRGIILSTKANVAEGLPALAFATAARKQLEQVIAIDPNPLGDGSAYAILGALYDGVPGFPVGFGDKRKARNFLEKAISQNPTGAETNYFYGEYLVGQKQYKEAKQALQTALGAAPRVGREIGDKGRRADIAAELGAIDGKNPNQ